MQPVASARRRYDMVVVREWTFVEGDEVAMVVEQWNGCREGEYQRDGGIEH